MSKIKKNREQMPTIQNYSELISTIDMMREAFQETKAKVTCEWCSWSMTTPKQGSIDKILERACQMWCDYNKRERRQLTLPIGATPHHAEDKCTVYFATCENGTEVEFYTTARIAKSAVKALLLLFTPDFNGLKLSEYLDGFAKARDHFNNGTCPSPIYAEWCWFEFVYSVGSEIGSPVRIASGEIPVVLDFFFEDYELAQKEQAILSYSRNYPEVRCIEHEFFNGSILALKFLRIKQSNDLSRRRKAYRAVIKPPRNLVR